MPLVLDKFSCQRGINALSRRTYSTNRLIKVLSRLIETSLILHTILTMDELGCQRGKNSKNLSVYHLLSQVGKKNKPYREQGGPSGTEALANLSGQVILL
jgi:hypothetical protein